MSIIWCQWCGNETDLRQSTSNTCACGRPPQARREDLVEIGRVGSDLKASTFITTHFDKPHYLQGRGCALYDIATKEPLRLRGAALYCDASGNLYQYRSDLA